MFQSLVTPLPKAIIMLFHVPFCENYLISEKKCSYNFRISQTSHLRKSNFKINLNLTEKLNLSLKFSINQRANIVIIMFYLERSVSSHPSLEFLLIFCKSILFLFID